MNRQLLLLVSLATLWTASPSGAGPTYMIAFNNGGANLPEVVSVTGFSRDTSFALVPSSGTGSLTGAAYAGPGYVSPFARIDCTWSSGFSGTFAGKTRARITSDDLIITGPAGPPVAGTIRLRVRFDLSKTGGYTNNNAHQTAFHLNASTLYSAALGTLTYGNFNLSGSGPFAGVASPNVDMIVPLIGNYPVNTPFSIQIYTEAITNAYGNAGYNPGMVSADGGGSSGYRSQRGVHLEYGQVMTLPPGYTLNSSNWGVVNNTYPHLVGVEDGPPARADGLALAGPNPTAGDSRLSLMLSREGTARVVVYDVSGRALRTLADGWQSAGTHRLVWDGLDEGGAVVPAGLYFVRAEVAGRRMSLAMVRIR